MLSSVSELKLLKSFRIPVEEADNVRFYIECKNESDVYVPVNSAKLLDLSISGLCFTTKERFKLGTDFKIYLQFKKHKVDVSGKVVRSYSYNKNEESSAYGIEFAPDEDVNKFLEQLILSFSYDRLRDCMVDKVLSEKTNSIHDGLEIFSLILSLFKDIMKFGKQSEFLESLLEEVTNVMNAQRATVFLINPEKNELEAIIALGTDKNVLHFDYRLGIAGSVFTTGVALNLDNVQQSSRFSNEFDVQTGFVTRSIICNPIYNREDKIIGVVEILNKRNQDQFTFEDEKIMKVVSLILSTVFHNYNPVSEVSQIRRFSTPFDRQHVLIGKSQYIENLRKSIIKLKDLDTAMLIEGENGSGKKLYAQIIHYEGKRGLAPFEIIKCKGVPKEIIEKEIWSQNVQVNKFEKCKGGTVLICDIDELSLEAQLKLFNVLKHRRVENSKLSVDVRLICTTTKDLFNLVELGLFNKDLFNLISISSVKIEPLKKRKEDIKELINYFLKIECKQQGFLLKNFSPKMVEEFEAYDWPGNIGELQSSVARAVLYHPKSHIINSMISGPTPIIDKKRSVPQNVRDIPYMDNSEMPLKHRMALIEREIIFNEIKKNKGNKSKTAKNMGISREALRKKILLSEEVIKEIGAKPKEKEDELKAA